MAEGSMTTRFVASFSFQDRPHAFAMRKVLQTMDGTDFGMSQMGIIMTIFLRGFDQYRATRDLTASSTNSVLLQLQNHCLPCSAWSSRA